MSPTHARLAVDAAPESTRTRHRTRGVRTPAGFTLLEVLIAVAIFAIVLAAINTVFYSALRLRNKAAESFEQALPVQRAIATIQRDLANLVPPNGLLSGSLQTTAMTNTVAGQASPDFYTASAMLEDTVPWGDIQKVSYALVEPANRAAGRDLYRAVTRNLLSATQEPPEQQWLMGNVQGIAFQFYDGSQWLDSWDSTVQTNLPLAAKVQIHLASPRAVSPLSRSAPIELVVPIDARGGTNQTQLASGGPQ
jgi:general secretion pathway protein J